MHAAGLWTVFSGALAGLPVVLYDDRTKFNPPTVWRTAEREKVGLMTMVGDAYAAPLIEELRRNRLRAVVAVRHRNRAARQPIRNTRARYWNCCRSSPSSTATGRRRPATWASGTANAGSHRETFDLRTGGCVASDDLTRFLEPGDTEVGWVVRTGRIPLGYFDDAEATRKTFPVVEGQRVVVSGDRASLEADGTLRLYGRDSLVVNTGGEKVFVEEVEAVLRARPGVADALVVGRESDRWGQEIVALVQAHPGMTVDAESLHAACIEHLARFKAPKEFIFVEQVRRLGNGKADYRWAKSRAVQQESADMTRKAIDCLVNVHFGETEQQPTWMLKVRDDYFKGPKSMFAPVDLPELLDEMDEQGVEKAILMDNLAKPSVDCSEVRRGQARPVRAGDGRSQPAAPDSGAAGAERDRQRPAGGVYRCRTELLGRRTVPA